MGFGGRRCVRRGLKGRKRFLYFSKPEIPISNPVMTHHIFLFAIRYRFISELFDGDEDSHPIADLLDSHLLENLLIAFEQVVPVDMVGYSLHVSLR